MTPKYTQTAACRVTGGEHLAADSGGADALCAAIGKAADGRAAVEVRVRTPYFASATVTLAGGRKLPAINAGIADRPLNRRSFEMLAQAVAAQVARESGK